MDWSSAPPPTSSAPAWATGGPEPLQPAPAGRAEAPANRAVGRGADSGSVAGPVTPAADVVDDPESISDDDEDIEASGEIGQAVVERLLGGTVIGEDEE